MGRLALCVPSIERPQKAKVMLQIASGKLFTNKPAQRNELRGVVYTNLQLYGREPIETAAGRLLPTSSLGFPNSAVYDLTELIGDPPVPGAVASHGIDPYISDFADIVSFVLNVTCTPDVEVTGRLTGGRYGSQAYVPPGSLVRRVFDKQVWCQDEDAVRLVEVAKDLIGLERRNYLAAMRAIRTYARGLRRLPDDPELTCTPLVASVESLMQGFRGNRPEWDDYPEDKRRRIDTALERAGAQTKGQVRNALLEIEHVAARRRFLDFALSHLEPSFFREEASGQESPIGRSDVPGTLNQAYDPRSRHIHELKELPKLLTAGFHDGETFIVDRVTMLTIQGMTRLARHVINEYVKRQPKVATEVYDYRPERAGIVSVRLAPRYWIGRVEDLNVASGRDRLEGFLVQIAAGLQDKADAEVTDLRNVLEEVEKLLPNASKTQRRSLLALYVLFNSLSTQESRMPGFEKVLGTYQCELDCPSVETMILHLLLGTIPSWPLEKHQTLHDDYLRQQGRPSSLRVPPILRSGLSLALAERYRACGEERKARDLISTAVENLPAHPTLCDIEETFDPKEAIPWKIQMPELGPVPNSVDERLSAGRAILASDVSGHE